MNNTIKLLGKNKHKLSFVLIPTLISVLIVSLLVVLATSSKTTITSNASRGSECQTECKRIYDRRNDPGLIKCINNCISDPTGRIRAGCHTYAWGMLYECQVNRCPYGTEWTMNPKTRRPECQTPSPVPTRSPYCETGMKSECDPYSCIPDVNGGHCAQSTAPTRKPTSTSNLQME